MLPPISSDKCRSKKSAGLRLAPPAARLALVLSLWLALLFSAGTALAAPDHALMPVPAELRFAEGKLPVTTAFRPALSDSCRNDPRLRDGLARVLRRAEERTGLTFAHTATAGYAFADDLSAASLVIDCANPGLAIPALDENESYTLDITPSQAVLRATTTVGALRGLETLLQLLQSDEHGWSLPVVTIKDRPRFPWRGLMIDVCRHWQPIDVIKRNLDAMAVVKLNVLHLHLTEDQGFRIECKTFPRLHELGSDGYYFTQDQMRDIIAYAAARGIRVVPEFDIPGHATSWLVGHPELASAPGPYTIERKWGIFDPVLDPTNPKVYEVLEAFLGEMASLFPDVYVHIGGDENNGVHWNANPRIQTFIREHNLKDNPGLHAYFNTRVHAILAKHGKKLIGWDEILHPDLPAGSVVHSWRGPEGIAEATKRGYATVLSNGYYIDLSHPTRDHYLNDPAPANVLTPEQERLVLGGEATMWSEWVTPETIDSRIWPRTAAIAERLWSARDVSDVADMYRRLALVSRRLEEAGLRHESYIDPALRRLAGDSVTPADLRTLRTFVDLLEPVKKYQRGRHQKGTTQLTPLTGLVDCVRPDSAAARVFTSQVEALVFGVSSPESTAAVAAELAAWRTTAGQMTTGPLSRAVRLREATPLIQALSDTSRAGEEALRVLASKQAPAPDWLLAQLAALDRAAQPHAAAELPAIASVRLLVAAAAEQEKRASLTAEAWRKHLETITAKPQPARAAH